MSSTSSCTLFLLILASYLSSLINGFITELQPSLVNKHSANLNNPEPTVIPATPPTPPKFPIIGTLPDFLFRGGIDSFSEIYETMYRDYGPNFGMSLPGLNELVISDPRLYDKYALSGAGKYPMGGLQGFKTVIQFYKESNLTIAMKGMSHGKEWEEWRSTLNSDLNLAWETYLPMIAETAKEISRVAGYELTKKKNVEFDEFLTRASSDLFSAVLTGESLHTTNSKLASDEDLDFIKASNEASFVTGRLLNNPLDKLFGIDLYKLFKIPMEKAHNFSTKKTESAVSQVTKQQELSTAVTPKGVADEEKCSCKCPLRKVQKNFQTAFHSPSLIERLVNRGDLSTIEIAEVTAPLLMQAVDNVPYLMNWLYLNLASNPDVQTKLAAELKAVLNGADLTTKAQMDSLPYLKACIRESHRLTPTFAMLKKKFDRDIYVVVPKHDIESMAYRLNAGDRLSLNLRGIPMDPAYVDNPKLYQPERFLPSAIAARKGTPSEIIDHPAFMDPFGRGKRRCLAVHIVNAEVMVLVARLIQDWDIKLVDDRNSEKKWKPRQKLFLKADPYPPMSLIPRR